MSISFGVVGTGWITDSFITSAQTIGKWKLAAIYSREAKTGMDFGAKYQVDKVYTSIESLSQDSAIQAVYVASPNSFHHKQAKQLLSAKKHVIIEKPATSTVDELDDLFTVAKQNGVYLLEAFRHLHEGNFHILRDNLDRLGPIYGASLTYASYSSRYSNVLDGETPNIFSLLYAGGALVDLGVYPISFAVALFGKPKSQTYKPVIIATGADGGGMITLNYEKFAVAINASKIYTSTAPSEVYGEKGTLIVNATTDIGRVSFLDAKTKKMEELAVQKVELNLQEESDEFARIILSDDKEAASQLEKVSRAVIDITTNLREQNNIVFQVEQDAHRGKA